MSQVKIEIYVGSGKVKAYNKCSTLTDKLHGLNKAGREEAEAEKVEKKKSAAEAVRQRSQAQAEKPDDSPSNGKAAKSEEPPAEE